MIGFTVADIERETAFFTKVLSFEKVSEFRVSGSEYDKMQGVFNANMRIIHLKLGEQVVELTQYVSPPTGRPIPIPSYSNDEWFEHLAIVVRDMDAAYKILQENNVQQISANPITIPDSNPGAAGIKAIKFRDPEGHDLELIYLPAGKGDPAWQKPTNRLFLGIDHTAMTVHNTEKGVTFYRDLLGFDVGGVTLQHGSNAGGAGQSIQRHMPRHADGAPLSPATYRIPRLQDALRRQTNARGYQSQRSLALADDSGFQRCSGGRRTIAQSRRTIYYAGHCVDPRRSAS